MIADRGTGAAMAAPAGADGGTSAAGSIDGLPSEVSLMASPSSPGAGRILTDIQAVGW